MNDPSENPTLEQWKVMPFSFGDGVIQRYVTCTKNLSWKFSFN